jgi:hypothetical protein
MMDRCNDAGHRDKDNEGRDSSDGSDGDGDGVPPDAGK